MSRRKKKTKPKQKRPPVIQHRDRFSGHCPTCNSALSLRTIENFPVPVQDVGVVYHLKFCYYCGWNDGRVEIGSNRELTEYEIAQIQAAVEDRIRQELSVYSQFQQKLSTLPFGLAGSVMGAAMGYDRAELSMGFQVMQGVSPDVAYGEICAALAQNPHAHVFFGALAEMTEGKIALLWSARYWQDMGFRPPWADLVKGKLDNEPA